jgi:8-oxo-dGTP pyrophosphatase MutT (NUDIX family)
MKKVWQLIGVIGFWVGWPALYLYLRHSKRTRVFIRHNDELLVLKGWLGNGGWIFPGGGLHHGEDPVSGAVRETYEETGIRLDPQALTFIFERPITTPQKLRFNCIAYGIDLAEKPVLKQGGLEITAAAWRPTSELLAEPTAANLLSPALAAWDKLGPS